MVGYRFNAVFENGVPQTVEYVRAGVVAEPVDARYPYFFAVLVVYPVAVGVQPVVALLRL